MNSTDATALHACYARNMTAMFRVDARLAQQIDETPADPNLRVEPGRKGLLTAAVTIRPNSPPEIADGASTANARTAAPVYLHSKVDPQDEARRWAEAVPVGEDCCFVIGGFGLGYHLRALADRLHADALLVVCEPSLALLKEALAAADFTNLLVRGRIAFITRPDKAHLQDQLERHNTLMMLGTRFVPHPPSERVAGDFHAACRRMITEHLTACRMSLLTTVTNARITCRNVLNNMPRYLSTPPIDVLADRFKGLPGIVIAAGPSLREAIPRLKELQDRAVLISVQTTFKTLLDHGIQPHYVTSLDYHEMSRRFFEGLPPDVRTHLVAEPKVTWHVPDAYPGPTSMLDNVFARRCVGDALAGRDGLKAGATVAHLAFYLAVYLGCDPIVLVGQDLAYTNHVYYVPGVAIHDLWRPQLNRYCTIEMMEWERIVRSRKILMKVRDIHGRSIYTDEQLFTYLQQFEGDFAQVPGRVIDATGGGVRKAGTRVMSLGEVAATYCQHQLPADRLAYLDRLRWDDRSRLSAAREQLCRRKTEIDALADTCRQLRGLLDELTELLDRPAEFNRRIADVDALRVRLRRQESAYLLVSAVSQHAELQRFSADRRLEVTGASGLDKARGQLQRDRQFCEAILDGIAALHELLDEAVGRFDAAIDPSNHPGERRGTTTEVRP